jgi:hypothetical protein
VEVGVQELLQKLPKEDCPEKEIGKRIQWLKDVIEALESKRSKIDK